MHIFIRRWPVWIILATLLLAGLVPAFTWLHGGRPTRAHAALNTGPSLLLQPAWVNPGGTLNVVGSGFTSGEAVYVYIPQAALLSAYTTTTGSFVVTAPAPMHYSPNVKYFVYADNVSGTEKARTQLYFVPPTISWRGDNPFDGNYVPYGSPFTVNGQGFLPEENVTLYWDYQQQSQLKVGTVLTAMDGTFTVRITAKSSPSQLYSYANLGAVGIKSKLQAIAQIPITTAIVLTPTRGPLGKALTVRGGSFWSNETVTVTFGQYTEATVTTDTSVAFVTSFVTPTSVNGGGSVFVQATDSSGRLKPYTHFIVPSTFGITPATGQSGTTITLNGTNLGANYYFSIEWVDPVSGTLTSLGNVTADNQGTISTMITAPANLMSGRGYRIVLFSSGGLVAAQATFLAQ
jgi:hypothetical protein